MADLKSDLLLDSLPEPVKTKTVETLKAGLGAFGLLSMLDLDDDQRAILDVLRAAFDQNVKQLIRLD